jgi:hypothetical protein
MTLRLDADVVAVKKLSQSGDGDCWVAEILNDDLKKQTGSETAVIRYTSASFQIDENLKQTFLKEVAILYALNAHQNIIKVASI